MLISVIITTYKRPVLLQRAVRSVLAQKLAEGDYLQLIISDDDQNAGALAGIAALEVDQQKNVAFKYLKKRGEPGGVAASRNCALAASEGDWIIFLDDDD